ncbi:methyl-accepting chemotaxis protein [Alkalihalobacillus sp. AL-G]|uniref:methyl-accepting chemotaxis protein n=1 Tax=Alkalihalobacillus sp. AL-G TaxID=2926399 RepID=UPI00272C02B9|nr:HAMP domain-containing methyl-accepting chemotaxis protein [Alkalihalobacillus sp. AL-G]WLD93640.1 methyl-accepting chemotaxis protein [Alkalihalobacillus sp. AL-G]
MSVKSTDSAKKVPFLNLQRTIRSVGVKLFLVLVISLLISTPISTLLNNLISDYISSSISILLNTVINLAVTSLFIMLSVRFIILKPLQETVRAMKNVAKGQLTTEINIRSNDEFGQLSKAFNQMTKTLQTLIHDVTVNGEQVAETSEQFIKQIHATRSSSQEISTMMAEVASGADTQLSGAEQTAHIMEEMTAGIQRIAESASIVAEMSNKATEEVDVGKTYMAKARKQMDAIDSVTDNVAEEIQHLNKQSKEINQIVNVITEIANQTNLLALNAAIEAARAGEHGKGFAVVAKEVQKLAEQSEQSASQISELVKRIQSHTLQTVSTMEKGKDEVNNGTVVISDAEQTFEKIAGIIEEVAGQVQDVSASVEEISASSEQVHSSTSETAKIARGSATQTQQVSATTTDQLNTMELVNRQADDLTKTAQALLKSVASFKLK